MSGKYVEDGCISENRMFLSPMQIQFLFPHHLPQNNARNTMVNPTTNKYGIKILSKARRYDWKHQQ